MHTEHLLTEAEFIAHVEACFDPESLECLYERISEVQGEINMFGDSGPGSMYYLRQTIEEMQSQARQYKRLTGRTLTVPRLPTYRN
jgi:hypothetical protein